MNIEEIMSCLCKFRELQHLCEEFYRKEDEGSVESEILLDIIKNTAISSKSLTKHHCNKSHNY